MTEVHQFLLYRAADHAAARENPYIRDLVAFISAEGLRGEQAAVHLIRNNEPVKAAYAAAKAEALDELFSIMHRPDPQQETPREETFIDDRDPKDIRRKR